MLSNEVIAMNMINGKIFAACYPRPVLLGIFSGDAPWMYSHPAGFSEVFGDVSKIELTCTLSVNQSKSEVDKYFTTRLIAAPEVATTLLSYQIASSTCQITLDTDFDEKKTSVQEIEYLD